MPLRQRIGAWIHDWPRYLRTIQSGRWPLMHNRDERISTDERGVQCEWRFTSDLHIARIFPRSGARLLRAALAQWPVVLRDRPPASAARPAVSFVIGHRGLDRLPHLNATLRSIAGQSGASIECIVVEQAASPEIEKMVPDWVRYVFTESHTDYNRSAALNAGTREAAGDVVILHDNDMIVPDAYAAEVLARVHEGWEFINLKRFIFYLDPMETQRVFDRGAIDPATVATVVQNLQGGSIAAVPRAYLAIGGFDEEFVGWGGEDIDFWDRAATTKRTYAFGFLPIVHLYHPPQRGKLRGSDAPAIRRYREMENIDPEERIRRLTAGDE